MQRKTRLSTFSHLASFVGRGKHFNPSELPTVRDVLQYGILLREQSEADKRNYSSSSLANDIYNELIMIWQRANTGFQVPVLNSKVTVVKRIQDVWEKANDISLGRGKLALKEAFISKLDKLFDITNCKCDIAHTKCTCPKERRIPPGEVWFHLLTMNQRRFHWYSTDRASRCG